MSARVHLVIFPGEGTSPAGVTTGHIYVVGGRGESYEMAGGPPPGKGYHDLGGHTAGVTPTGNFVLDKQEHHTTQNWPMSVIPWLAKLREHMGEVQYQVGTHWHTASGPHGTVTKATLQFMHRSGKHPGLAEVVKLVRKAFYDLSGRLIPAWNLNDFGNWSWNLKKHGHRTAYYIHTTPQDEAASAAHSRFVLTQSHGCIHIRPADRDEMMKNGHLKEGMAVEITGYGKHGPP